MARNLSAHNGFAGVLNLTRVVPIIALVTGNSRLLRNFGTIDLMLEHQQIINQII